MAHLEAAALQGLQPAMNFDAAIGCSHIGNRSMEFALGNCDANRAEDLKLWHTAGRPEPVAQRAKVGY